ncbi:uncharacterized protein LOC129701618 [Leucoraja erinacea]|uniref:uncharacterized protein LOC129701618 n=1 Tax=Leucoraja erinaceus TaxID=7782 RepID=UPI002456EF60|nr:uncharacterized protein LOC129701618 [Leucoraja erinacea]
MREIIPRFGIPIQFSSDYGPHFIGQINKEFCEHLGIQQQLHCAYRPQAAGLLERANQTLKTKLAKLKAETGLGWIKLLLIVLFQMRVMPVGKSRLSPAEIVYGRPVKTSWNQNAMKIINFHQCDENNQFPPYDCGEPLVNRFIRLEAVGTEDVSGGLACDANRAVEPKPKRPKAGKAIVVGDSIVRGTDRGFCGNRQDARIVCCLPGARIQDVTDRVQKILKGEGEHPEVVVHVGINDVGKKGMNILQRDFRELGKMLKSRASRVVISGLLPVPQTGESRNREIRDLNVWLRNWCTGQGFRFLDHWDLFWGKGELYKRDGLHLKRCGTSILAGRFAAATRVALN